jgi:hypothetical protein
MSRGADARSKVHECAMTEKGGNHRFRSGAKGPLGLTEKNFLAGKYFVCLLFFWEAPIPIETR